MSFLYRVRNGICWPRSWADPDLCPEKNLQIPFIVSAARSNSEIEARPFLCFRNSTHCSTIGVAGRPRLRLCQSRS